MRKVSRSSPRQTFPVVHYKDSGVLESGFKTNKGNRSDTSNQKEDSVEMPKIKVVKRKKGSKSRSRSRSRGSRMMSPAFFRKWGSPGRNNGF